MQNSTKNLLFILLLVCFGLAGGNPDATKPGMVQVRWNAILVSNYVSTIINSIEKSSLGSDN